MFLSIKGQTTRNRLNARRKDSKLVGRFIKPLRNHRYKSLYYNKLLASCPPTLTEDTLMDTENFHIFYNTISYIYKLHCIKKVSHIKDFQLTLKIHPIQISLPVINEST